MKAIKSIDEQFIEIFDSLGIKSQILHFLNSKIKGDKIYINGHYEQGKFRSSNDYEFYKSFNFKFSSKNDLESLTKKIKDKLKNLNAIETIIAKADDVSERYVSYMKENHNLIIEDIKNSLGMDKMTISDWYGEIDPFYDKIGFGFHVHPINKAPADGGYFTINSDYEISVGSRTGYRDSMDDFLKNIKYSSDPLIGMGEKMEDMKKIQNFMQTFEVSDKIKQVLLFLEEGNKLYLELKELLKK